MANNLPSFWVGTSTNYEALQTKDANALYFLTDTQQIVRGTQKFSQEVQFVANLPESGVRGVIYYVTGTGVASVWNGTQWKQIGVTTVSDITGAGVQGTDVPNVTALNAALSAATSNITSAYSDAISAVNSSLSSAIDTKVTAVEGYQLMSADESTKLATYPANYSDVTSTMDSKISAAVASAFKYRGTVADMTALEAVTGMVTGDVYHVTTGANGSSAEYVYNGTGWEELGTIVDMSGFATKVDGGVSGNLVALDGQGDIVDGGVAVGGATLAASVNSTTLATEAAVKAYADSAASAAQSAATAVANSAQSAADAAQSTADGKIAKIASAVGGKVALTTSAGELTESEFVVGGAVLDTTPSSTILATEAAVYSAVANANATVNSAKMDKVESGATSQVLMADANGQAVTTGKVIGGSTFALTGNENLLATEAAVKAAIDDVTSALAWQTIPSAE